MSHPAKDPTAPFLRALCAVLPLGYPVLFCLDEPGVCYAGPAIGDGPCAGALHTVPKGKGKQMKRMKRVFALLPALALCLVLAACADNHIDGADWRTWGIVRDYGVITRDNTDTDVLVCLNKQQSTFYYDTDGQVPFSYVEYPPVLTAMIKRAGDVWSIFLDADFADLNGDGNSDVTMRFAYADEELVVVWLWEPASGQYVVTDGPVSPSH